jgi:hypothetical protein
MERPGAREILQALILGFDPFTGEELEQETVLQKADVIRAMLAGVAALDADAARAQRRAHLPENVGRAWTKEEEEMLVAAFRAGEDLRIVSRQHGRTLNAIEARLERLGLITSDQRITRNRFLTQGPGAPARSGSQDKRTSKEGKSQAPES